MIKPLMPAPFFVSADTHGTASASIPLSPYDFDASIGIGAYDIPSHRHSHVEIMTAESGTVSASHVINGQEYPVKRNTVCFLMPYHVHSLKNPKGSLLSCRYLDFDMGFFFAHIPNDREREALFGALQSLPAYIECSQNDYNEICEHMGTLVKSKESHPNQAASPFDQYRIMRILELLLKYKEPCPIRDKDGWGAVRSICTRLTLPLEIDQVAQEVGMTPATLNRWLKREYGATFSKALTQARVRYATILLCARPRESISTIAKECGIQSENTFFRLFKESFGMTPKEYRRRTLIRFFDADEESLPSVLSHEMLLYTYEHHAEQISLYDLADVFGVNPIKLNEDFSQCIGMTFPQYLTVLRIEHAKHLLSMTTLSVGDIAQSVGYASTRSFVRTFSRHTGEAPSSYRKRFAVVIESARNLPLNPRK